VELVVIGRSVRSNVLDEALCLAVCCYRFAVAPVSAAAPLPVALIVAALMLDLYQKTLAAYRRKRRCSASMRRLPLIR